MPWDETQLTPEDIARIRGDAPAHPLHEQSGGFGGGAPDVTRVHVKVEDVHRTDLPGCPRHRTAGAIQQFTSWIDPATSRSEGRWTGYCICAECSMLLDFINPHEY